MNKYKLNKNNAFFQKGRSMVEMLGVLAIIGVLSTGALWGYTAAMGKYRNNKFIEQINSVEIGARIFFGDKSGYDDLDTNLAIKLGLIPDDMVKNNTVTHIFGGKVNIREGFHSNQYFSIDIYNIPKNACIYYLSNGLNDRISHVFDGVVYYVPLDMQDITALCKDELNTLQIAYIES